MRDKEELEILEDLIAKTGAEVLPPSQQELAELREVAEFKERSEADRALVREKLMHERSEAELLRLARGEVPSAD